MIYKTILQFFLKVQPTTFLTILFPYEHKLTETLYHIRQFLKNTIRIFVPSRHTTSEQRCYDVVIASMKRRSNVVCWLSNVVL